MICKDCKEPMEFETCHAGYDGICDCCASKRAYEQTDTSPLIKCRICTIKNKLLYYVHVSYRGRKVWMCENCGVVHGHITKGFLSHLKIVGFFITHGISHPDEVII